MVLEWGLIRRPPCRPRRDQRFGPFEAVATVAEGRRTDALLARHDELDGPWLLRILHPDQDRRGFARELDYASAFEGAARVDGAAEYEGLWVAHQRPVVGETLATVLGHLFETKTVMPAELAVAIILGIAARIRDPARVHGDLVPHHVLIGYDGYVHLIDPAPPESLMDRGEAPGRAGYRSPEHIAAAALGPSSDVFSLGVLLFELTTGHRLFDGDDPLRAGREILSGEYKRPRSVVEAYPIELQVVLRRMLRAAAPERFPDPTAAAEALRRTSERARSAGPALGDWLTQAFADRRGAWQIALRAAGFDLPSMPPRAATLKPKERPIPAPASVPGPVLTLEDLERADRDGLSLFDSPPLDFERPGSSEVTAPSEIGPAPSAPAQSVRASTERRAIVPEAAPRSDTLLDPGPRVPTKAPAPTGQAPRSVPPPRAAPPRPVPKVSRPPDRPRVKAPVDLASDLLEDFGAAPVTDRGPAPASIPAEPVDQDDLEFEVAIGEEPGTEVAIPLPRRIQRSPSMGPEGAVLSGLGPAQARVADDRADTTLDPPRNPTARVVPPRKEATMVVRDRGPKSRPPPGANPSPPPTPKPSSVPPPADPKDVALPLEPLPDLQSHSTSPPPARRHSSLGPLPRRPAQERSASVPAPVAPRRREPKDPTSEQEQLVIPVVEEETPARKRRALLVVMLTLVILGALGGVGVAHYFPEWIPGWLPKPIREQLVRLERPRPPPQPEPSPRGSIPPTTITPPPIEAPPLDPSDLPPLEPLVPPPVEPDPSRPDGEIAVRIVVFPARARIVVDGERIANGETVSVGASPRVIELRARGCTPYRGTLDASAGESFEMILPCKPISRPRDLP